MPHVTLTNDQIDQVSAQLDREGLRFESLRYELLDHICCHIEAQMSTGQGFEAALQEGFAAFGQQAPRQIESDIISTLNYPHIIMQKIMLTGGVLTAILMLFVFWVQGQEIPSLKPVDQPVTSAFGMRMHPTFKEKRHHTGVDIRADEGTPVYASADGTVNLAGIDETRKAFGVLIQVTHADGYETRYAHLSKVAVTVGQEIKKGDLIGYTGNTGKSIGPHLHYEVRKDGKPVNPENYFGDEE